MSTVGSTGPYGIHAYCDWSIGCRLVNWKLMDIINCWGNPNILPKIIFKEIKKLKPGQGGEIHITDAIKNLIYKDIKFYGNIFKGRYLDCGTINGYINSCIEIYKGKK